jgi:hypothetical protein
MVKWQENKDFILLPLNWHGNEDASDDDDANDDAEDNTDDTNSGDSKTEKDKKSDTSKKSTKTKKDGDNPDDDVLNNLPDNVDSLSAQELRDLLRIQSGKLRKAESIARKRLQEIMEKKEKFKEIEAEKEAARLKELEEKEEYKKLYETIKPKYDVLAKDTGKTHTFFEDQLTKLIEDLPEDYQKLVPEVDVRERIAWIENFKATVLKKEKEALKTSTNDTGTKKKSDTSVGNSGSPTDDPDKTKADDKSTIEAAINNCSSPEELERLLAGLAKKGL